MPGSGDVPSAHDVNINEAGTFIPGDTLEPPALCIIMRLKTAAALRSGRGHIALPSPRASSVFTSSALLIQSGTYWNNLQALAALLDDSLSIGTISPVTIHPVVYSRVRRIKGFTPWTFNVTQAIPQAKPHWLRSRMTAP